MRKQIWLPLLLASALASAQTPTGNTPQPRVMSIEPTQTVSFDGSLVQLRGRLNLSDVQQSAWGRFASSVEGYTRTFFAEKPQTDYPAENAPRQLERMNERMKARMLSLQSIETEAKALYAVLRVEQQKTADQYLMASIPVFGFLPPTR